jgi:hypothetical protein
MSASQNKYPGKYSWRKNEDGTYTRTDPNGTERIVSAWDPVRLHSMGCALIVLVVVVAVIIAFIVGVVHASHH